MHRFSSRREPLGKTFLASRLQDARSYDRIVGIFPSSLGELRLMLGTDAASEGLNLQRLATLINLDLPWNPTRLEQRKGRIQRIGQVHDTVKVYNLRYKDSVEDRVHELLSTRLQDIHSLFGQIPDVLEDAWVAIALGEKEEAKRIIDALPKEHPFEIRYTQVEKVDWESCATVLSASGEGQSAWTSMGELNTKDRPVFSSRAAGPSPMRVK